MIARLAVLVGIVLSTAGAQYSCSSGGTGIITDRDLASGEGPTFSTTLILRDSTGVQVDHFDRLELIRFELTVRNRTDSDVTIDMPSSAGADFLVFVEGQNSTRWRWSEGRTFTTQVTHIQIKAHESKVFTFDWNQELRNGAFLARGRYEARGILPETGFPADPLEADELGSNLRLFTID